MRTVTLAGTYNDSSGRVIPGVRLVLTCTRVLSHADDNIVIPNDPVRAITDAKGRFSVKLIPTQAGIAPSRFLYRIDEHVPGRDTKTFHVRIDASSPDVVSLASVYRTEAPDFSEEYPTLDQVRRIAADLDAKTYDAVSQVTAQTQAQSAIIETLLSNDDLNLVVPQLVDGKVQASQIPTVRFADVTVANSQAQMLDVTAQKGRVTVRTDVNKAYVLMGNDPTVSTSWVQITDGTKVDSINGQTGVVQLNAQQVGAAPAIHTHETLSGYQYSATYLKSQVAQTLLSHTIGGDGPTVTVTGDSVIFRNAQGDPVFAINPHTLMDVSQADITVTYSNNSTGVVPGSFVKQNPFTLDLQFGFTVHGLVPKHFTKGPQLAGFNAVIFGTWAQLDAVGAPIDAGHIVRSTNGEFVFVGLTSPTPGMIVCSGSMVVE